MTVKKFRKTMADRIKAGDVRVYWIGEGYWENGLEMSIKDKAIIQNEKAPWSYIPDFENKKIKRLHLHTFNGRNRDEYIGY